MRKSYNYSSWALILYDYVDNTTDLLLTLKQLLKDKIISTFIFILHNKDDNENHIHLGIVFKQVVSLSYVKRVLFIKQNILGEKLNDRYEYYKYLTHNDTDKYIYDINDIVSNNINYFKNNKVVYDSENIRIQNMLEDYFNGESYLNMALKYGRDFILNYNKYKEYFDLIRTESESIHILNNKI